LNLNAGLNKICTNLHLKFIFEIFINKVISLFKVFIIQVYKNEFVKIRTAKNLYMPMCGEENEKGLKFFYDKYRLEWKKMSSFLLMYALLFDVYFLMVIDISCNAAESAISLYTDYQKISNYICQKWKIRRG